MPENSIHTLDLNFMGLPGAIAAYLLPHRHGAVLVECGPGSTLPYLCAALKAHGYSPADITDVLVTHIHLDHAGAAGWLARQGARVHVHPVGAPHLRNPDKLLTSAQRIYGDMLDTLWGEFLAAPADRLSVLSDGEVVEIDGLRFLALDTPGHADHHFAYLHGDTLFSGDIGGVRLAGIRHIRLPMPPPEFHLEKWVLSLERLERESFTRIATTHYGIHNDSAWHLGALRRTLVEVRDWMEAHLPFDPPLEELNTQFLAWARQRSERDGVDQVVLQAYETANPSWMSTHGIQRYWRKYRQ